jgi:hypothetical protein
VATYRNMNEWAYSVSQVRWGRESWDEWALGMGQGLVPGGVWTSFFPHTPHPTPRSQSPIL